MLDLSGSLNSQAWPGRGPQGKKSQSTLEKTHAKKSLKRYRSEQKAKKSTVTVGSSNSSRNARPQSSWKNEAMTPNQKGSSRSLVSDATFVAYVNDSTKDSPCSPSKFGNRRRTSTIFKANRYSKFAPGARSTSGKGASEEDSFSRGSQDAGQSDALKSKESFNCTFSPDSPTILDSAETKEAAKPKNLQGQKIPKHLIHVQDQLKERDGSSFFAQAPMPILRVRPNRMSPAGDKGYPNRPVRVAGVANNATTRRDQIALIQFNNDAAIRATFNPSQILTPNAKRSVSMLKPVASTFPRH